MPATKETFLGRKRRGVRRFENGMFCFIDERLLFLRKTAPEQENKVFFFI